MSPIGGVGINLAIQDAVATANLLAKPLLESRITSLDLARVQARRTWPTRVSTRDNCGKPVIEMPISILARLSRLSVSVWMPRMLIFSSARAALMSRNRPRRSKACSSISTGTSAVPTDPKLTFRTRAGDLARSRARLAQSCAWMLTPRPTVI